MARILILDGMWNKSLAAVRSFGRKGFFVTVGERTRLATALFSRYCIKRFIYPSPFAHPEDFLNVLERELKTSNYDVIFPMEYTTQILLTETSNRKRLQRYAIIPFADAELAKKVNDKAFLMRYANEKGIDIPKTYFVNKVEEIRTIKDSVKYPVVIKPRVSSGSRGIVYIRDEKELIPSYLKVHEKYSFPIVQEYIPGDETYGVGLLLNFQSEVRAFFVYKRLRSYPVNGGPSTLRESVKREDVREIAESLMVSIGWTGIAHVEFKIDPRDRKPKLLEVNPRFWGSLQLAIESGVDFPFLLYKMAVDGDVEPVRDYHAGIKCRWLLPGDMLHFLKNPDRFRLNPNFFNFRVKDDIISWHDPMPLLGRILSIFTFISDREMRELIKR